jgi:hypothetical protein
MLHEWEATWQRRILFTPQIDRLIFMILWVYVHRISCEAYEDDVEYNLTY